MHCGVLALQQMFLSEDLHRVSAICTVFPTYTSVRAMLKQNLVGG